MTKTPNQDKITQQSVLICDGLPEGIPSDKVPRLTLFMKKNVLLNNGAELSDSPNNIQIYIDEETNKTTGIGFIDFKNDHAAITFKSRFQELKFDSKHTLKFYTKKEVDEILKEDDEYSPLRFTDIEVNDFKGWLKNENYLNGNEYALSFYHNESVNIAWYNPSMPKGLNYDFEIPFQSRNVAFSPAGTFIYAVTEKGLLIYQPDIKKRFQFPHPGLTHVTISKDDTFIATYSMSIANRKHIIVWDRRFNKGVKFFELNKQTVERVSKNLKTEKTLIPVGEDLVKFSADEKYMARMSEVDPKSVEIYVTPTLTLMNNKYVTFENTINKISWSPFGNILVAYHEPLQKNNEQAHFYFYDVDKQEVIYKHKVFSLREAEFFWHNNGKKLVVKCVKAKKTAILMFTFEKEITVTMNEFSVNPIYLEMNPVKQQFGLLGLPINKKGAEALDPTFYLYDISTKENKLVTKIDNVEIKSFSYSPNGQFVVLSGIGKAEPHLYFYNADKMKLYKKVEAENMSYIAWDPMGLFLSVVRSYVYTPHAKNGIIMYDCFGNMQFETYKQNFAGLLWRPQPQLQLTEEMKKEVDMKFKESIKTMREEDERRKEQVEKEKREKAEKLLARYNALVRKNIELAKKEKLRQMDDSIKMFVEERREKIEKVEEEEESEEVQENEENQEEVVEEKQQE